MTRVVRQASRPVAPKTSGTDHRLWWSVVMGVPPAKLHEEPRGTAGIPRCARWFFDPVIPCGPGSMTDDKIRSSVPLVETPKTGQEACPT